MPCGYVDITSARTSSLVGAWVLTRASDASRQNCRGVFHRRVRSGGSGALPHRRNQPSLKGLACVSALGERLPLRAVVSRRATQDHIYAVLSSFQIGRVTAQVPGHPAPSNARRLVLSALFTKAFGRCSRDPRVSGRRRAAQRAVAADSLRSPLNDNR